MRNKTLLATENVKIDGVWRVVEVWGNTLSLAARLGPKAARRTNQKTGIADNALVVKVRPA